MHLYEMFGCVSSSKRSLFTFGISCVVPAYLDMTLFMFSLYLWIHWLIDSMTSWRLIKHGGTIFDGKWRYIWSPLKIAYRTSVTKGIAIPDENKRTLTTPLHACLFLGVSQYFLSMMILPYFVQISSFLLMNCLLSCCFDDDKYKSMLKEQLYMQSYFDNH